MYISRKLLRLSTCAAFVSAGAGFFAVGAAPALAQEGEYPSNQEQHPGQIVYSRDVPHGIAIRRIAQGEAQTVAPDQSRLIINTILIGLEPMSDADQAGVTAPLARPLDVTNQVISIGLSQVSGPKSSADFTRSESGASLTGGIVGRSLNVLPSALSVISRTAGSGQ